MKSLQRNFMLLFFIWAFSCDGPRSNEKPDTSEIQYSEEVAAVIERVTYGIISPESPVQVIFVNPVVDESFVGKEISNPFEFSPSASGKARWVKTNVLEFTPDKPFASRTNYTGKVRISEIISGSDLNPVSFKFFAQGQEIISFSGDLDLLNPNDPQKLVYRGKVSFSLEESMEDVQKAASLDGQPLNWNQEDSKTFSFASNPLIRKNSIQKYSFEIKRSGLDLEEGLEREVTVEPLGQLKISAVEKDESGKNPKIMIKFSDQLDMNQSLEGFLTISPDVGYKLQKLGRYLVVDGDFRFGSSYTVSLASGVKSKWATKTEEGHKATVDFPDIQPQVEFASNGIFMPTSNEKNLQFLTTNLQRVHVEVKKVFTNNIEDFFSNEVQNSSKDRNTEFRNTYVSSVGAIVYNQTLEIGGEKNKWLLHSLDLSKVLNEFSNGLYLIRINFNPADVLVQLKEDRLSYIQKNGQIYKPVTITDIGLLAKRYGNNSYKVYTTDLKSGSPLPSVRVTLKRYDSKYSGTTDGQGMTTISGSSYIQLIKAEHNGQISIIKPNEMQWSNSGFDIGGISPEELNTRAFLYTERGVYRPGDSLNLSCIVRYNGKSGADNIPAELRLYNPEGTLVHEQTVKKTIDGFYNFNFGTDQNAPTGNWSARVRVGNKYFYHTLKVETVVANKLKVKVTPQFKTLLPENKKLEFEVESRYLFGATADGLPYETEVEVFDVSEPFAKFLNYSFFNQYIEFQDIRTKIQTGNLNDDGKATVVWNVPNLSQAPSPLKVKLMATVQEEGGRPNNAWAYLDLHPFSHYVGIDRNSRYTKLGAKQDINVVLVDHLGNLSEGRDLAYRIYRNSSYWWYQYDNYRDFKLRFKSDKHSYLVEEGIVKSSKPFGIVPFLPQQSGQYLIEVQDASNPSGHVSSVFVSAYPYGGIPSGDENAGTLALRSDKESYEVGETATISFPSPRQGNILLTVEQGDKILLDKWVTPVDMEDMSIKLKISELMAPNVYVTVTALQDHAQTVNDRPIRMFGIVPIKVVDPATQQNVVIDMPEKLRPKEEFDIEISTKNGKQTQFTVAVVDEGLLDITGFRTPDPWKEFFRKIRLGVSTYDLFGHVIGANSGDVFKTFSIGGDMDYRESQVDPFEKKKRFKPVSMFQGPMMTDSEGKATVHFTMPNYVGSVRVMVISAKGNSYGSAEKTVPVTSDLIIQPTIPRALKPGDEFTVPVNVFATREKLEKVAITMTTEGPIEVISEKTVSHTFDGIDDQLIYFKLKVNSAIGQGKITITGKGSNSESAFEADIPVSPSTTRVYQSEEKLIKPGQTITFKLPKLGLDGTNNARLNLAIFPNMDFLSRLDWLIQYPYGCIEQTTSSVFPQLALKGLFKDQPNRQKEIDKNINAGIDRLRIFQLSDGGFSYWPGSNEASEWGSNYAGQFLVEARRQGYVVPDGMYDGIVRYLERQSRRGDTDKKYLMTRVNRCFVLALADKAPLSEMNLLKQNHYEEMNSVQKWQLVAAYKLAGAVDKVQNLIDSIRMDVDEYNEFAFTYGSRNRDLGIILRCLVILEREEDASLLAKNLAEILSSNYWYSTQTVGQMLLGMGHYFDYAGISAKDDFILEGIVELPGGKKETIKTVNNYQLYINEGYGDEMKVTLDEGVDVSQMYAALSSNGVPLLENTEELNKNISLNLDWYNEDGEVIDVDEVTVGSTIYGRYTVINTSVINLIEEMALVQILPSGWEIENTRLSNEVKPQWMSGWNTGYEEYLDLRDDRVMWFFDLPKTKLDFVLKINVITEGTYQIPGARCEAMYNNDFLATKSTSTVRVVKSK